MACSLAPFNMSELKDQCSDMIFSRNEKVPLLSYRVFVLFKWIFLTGMCQGIAVFGVCANMINIICLIKQGFKDPVNISLCGLAVSDLGCLLTVIWSNICNTPAFTDADLSFEVMDVFYLTSTMPHLVFSRITAWITAFITFERCLCIASPLRVKSIVTPRRVSIITSCIFAVFVATGSPVYAVSRLEMKFVPRRNRTLLVLVHTADREIVLRISYIVNSICIPFCAFVIISVCTIILVSALQKKSKWRSKATNSEKANNVSTRNQIVAKMVVMISTLFIICFIPMNILFIAIILVPEFSIDGNDLSTVILIGGIGTLLESINSSMNIFIYYHMSSKFRKTFEHLFCIKNGVLE